MFNNVCLLFDFQCCNFKFLSGTVNVGVYYIISGDELFLALEEVLILRRYLFKVSK